MVCIFVDENKIIFFMNKVKGVLVVALILVISAPCFSSSITIKRKKNKWQHSIEQKTSDDMNVKSECEATF